MEAAQITQQQMLNYQEYHVHNYSIFVMQCKLMKGPIYVYLFIKLHTARHLTKYNNKKHQQQQLNEKVKSYKFSYVINNLYQKNRLSWKIETWKRSISTELAARNGLLDCLLKSLFYETQY